MNNKFHHYSLHPPYTHHYPYSSNIQPQLNFDNSQNWSRNGWPNVRQRDWSQSWNQFNHHNPTPHYGQGFENGQGSYIPQQAATPTNCVVAPEHGPRTLSVVTPEHPPRPQSVVAPEHRPRSQSVVTPEHRPQSQSVVTPEHRPRPHSVVAPEHRPRSQPRPHSVVAPEHRPRSQPQMCRLCRVMLSDEKSIEMHNNGKRHQKLLKQYEESKKQKAINRIECEQMSNSRINSLLPPKAANEPRSNGCLVEEVISESTVDKHKNILKKNSGEISKVPANIPQQTARSTNPVVAPKQWGWRQAPKQRGWQQRPQVIKCTICEVMLSIKNLEEHNNGSRHRKLLRSHEKSEKQRVMNRQDCGQTPNSLMNSVLPPKTVNKSKSNGCLVEKVSSESTLDKHKDYLKKNTKETSEVPAEKPQGELRDNSVAQGHGFKRKIGEDEYKNRREQKRRVTESSKPDGKAASSGCVGSLVQEPGVTRPEWSVAYASSNCVESLAQEPGVTRPEGSVAYASSNCVESLAQEPGVTRPEVSVALQEFSPVPAVVIQQVLQPEFEHQVSETIAQSLNPTDEANVQLPSIAAMEFDAPAGLNTNTETSDGTFQDEEKMDVCSTEEKTSPLSQVNICLKCGDQGFQETLVFCNKCLIYALHRYCLDGPVIYVEDVTWFCEDCEPAVVEGIDNIEISINQVEENSQQQQNIVAETKELLYDSDNSSHHALSQHSNKCDGGNEVEKEYQVVLKDAAANYCEETVTVENFPAATSDDNNSVGFESHAVAEPIIDPIWRGRFYLRNQGTGTFGGLLAHLSSLACSKALEEARLFPEEICVDLLERSEVWPNSFKKCAPNHDTIALYFFPENERAEREFDELVDDMIQFDHALRVELEHSELLVFPSTILPIQFRRFQAKYYLWGVFKSKKA